MLSLNSQNIFPALVAIYWPGQYTIFSFVGTFFRLSHQCLAPHNYCCHCVFSLVVFFSTPLYLFHGRFHDQHPVCKQIYIFFSSVWLSSAHSDSYRHFIIFHFTSSSFASVSLISSGPRVPFFSFQHPLSFAGLAILRITCQRRLPRFQPIIATSA